MAIIAVVSVVSHRRPRLEERVIKNIPLVDWLSILVFPVLMFIGWAGIVNQIFHRPKVPLVPLDDFNLLIVMTLFISYAFVGNGIHFTAKIIWRYLAPKYKRSMVYMVNERFHNKVGHYIVYVTVIAVLFLTGIAEINHPLLEPVSFFKLSLIILAGIVFGFAGAKAIFYTSKWFGGYNRPISVITAMAAVIFYSLARILHLSAGYYPVFYFMMTISLGFIASFILRQVFLFSRLSERNKLRFLARIFSG